MLKFAFIFCLALAFFACEQREQKQSPKNIPQTSVSLEQGDVKSEVNDSNVPLPVLE